MTAAQLQVASIAQLRNAQARERSESLGLPALLLELRQLRPHWHPQALGGTAEVNSQQRPQRVAELVRHHTHLVVAQLQQDARG